MNPDPSCPGPHLVGFAMLQIVDIPPDVYSSNIIKLPIKVKFENLLICSRDFEYYKFAQPVGLYLWEIPYISACMVCFFVEI